VAQEAHKAPEAQAQKAPPTFQVRSLRLPLSIAAFESRVDPATVFQRDAARAPTARQRLHPGAAVEGLTRRRGAEAPNREHNVEELGSVEAAQRTVSVAADADGGTSPHRDELLHSEQLLLLAQRLARRKHQRLQRAEATGPSVAVASWV
jgi:hypothetical protein